MESDLLANQQSARAITTRITASTIKLPTCIPFGS